MRKRARGRGVHSRGARGGSRPVTNPTESPKIMSYVQIQTRPRQSPSYIRINRGRGIPGRDKDNQIENSNGGILGNLVKAIGMCVAEDGTIDDNGNRLNGNYYLHKKFKKVTTTTSAEIQVEDIEQIVVKNGMLSTDIGILNSRFSPPSTNLASKKSSQEESPRAFMDEFNKSEDEIINNQKTDGALEANIIKNTSVYKPKFRMSRAGELNNDSSSEALPVIPNTNSAVVPPARITGDRRLDRQSLDDRISKIIDENQSILSTWPEHLSKRLKSQSQVQGSNSRNPVGAQIQLPSPSSIQRSSGGTIINSPLKMSGGSTTEMTPTINNSRTFVFDGRSPLPSPALDLCHSPMRKKFSFDNSSLSPFPKYNFPETGSLQSDGVCGIGDLSDSSSAASSTHFVVPKKRRRLSPSSTSFCGGEVSELPVKKNNLTGVVPINGFQDVDVTVRVSNCGPSGAQVTIRTNGASSNLKLAQSEAMDFNRIIRENGISMNGGSSNRSLNPNENHILSCTAIENQNSSLHHAERDFFPLDLNMKSGKPRGRPPRKRKPINATELDMSNSAITIKLPTVPLDLQMKKGEGSLEKCSTSTFNETINLFGKNGVVTVDCGDANKSASGFITNFSAKTIDDKHLLLQTSMPNPKRPTFLALKPLNQLPKAVTDPGVLPSPETPRGAKAYNQMYINGHAYTYLGFKISTRSSYTCLFKPQPMFIPQETDCKLSMYSNWQARPRDPKIGNNNIWTNDSSVNGRKSPMLVYVSAKGKNSETVTVNSPDGQGPLLFTPISELIAVNVPLDSPLPSKFAIELGVDPKPSSSSTPLTFSSTSKFLPNNKFESDSQSRTNRSCTSPIDQGNSSSSSSQSMNKNSSSVYHSGKYRLGGSKKSFIKDLISSSDSSSADESNYSLSKTEFQRRSFIRKKNIGIDGDGLLTMRLHSGSNDGKDSTLLSSSRSSPDFSRFDNPRVKIMEGGFESNEDYTYIRGRGRGRYVCEACGIRCKKPSMLRKHLKTHTDLRPYTCKLCNFSFKTKGNLTKHQKSKSHHKKCVGLGIHPNSSRSLAMSGPIFDNNNTSDEDDSLDEDDDNGCDSDTNHSNDDEGDSPGSPMDIDAHHFEKEIAQSLLDLSHLSRFPRNENTFDNINKAKSPEKQRISSFIEDFRGDTIYNESSVIKSGLKMDLEMEVVKSGTSSTFVEAPIDLSVKCKKDTSSSAKRTNGIVRAMGIVGEAQRWEPEEAFLLNGILNLKKVRNTEIHEEESSEDMRVYKPELIHTVAAPEVKVEVPEHIYEPITPELEKDNSFEYEIKKRCRSANNSLVESSILNPSTSFQIPLSLSPKPVSIPSPVSSGVGIAVSHPARLHQPWLSPLGTIEEKILTPPTPTRERTDSLNSCITGESSNSESVGCRDETESVGESVTQETIPSKGTVLEKPVGVCSPNSSTKSFAGLIQVKPQAEFRQPNGAQAFIKDEGKAECNICAKMFTRASQLTLHMNIHFLERPFRCDPCGVSFRTKGHLIKHRRSSSHDCKVYLTEAWGVANEENPRPFKCPDCKIAFRIHGHLAKHLRSKMHIMRMECLGKLPFGIYFEMEKSGLNLNEIDTTDCDMSLVSLQNVAKKIYGDTWVERLTLPIEDPV